MRGALRAVGVVTLVALVGLASAPRAAAQAAQVTTDVGPHYVGEAVAIRVTAVGFEEDPVPEVEVAPPAAGRLELAGVSPSVSQSITIVNGKISRTREVTHVFQFRYVPTRPGAALLGPFRLVQGGQRAEVGPVRLEVQPVPSTDDLAVEVALPPGPVFVGERVPFTVSFRLEHALKKNLLEYRLDVPLFDDQRFRFLDDGDGEGDTKVAVETAAGRLELRGRSQEHREGSKRYTTVSVTRTLVPLASGSHSIPPTSLSVEEGVRFRRDFFGGRRATQVRRWRAADPGGSLEVLELPARGRPESFGGAIGRGFSLEVAADRTVVQVGDPIGLTLLLRGEGLETASLPPLDADGLLPSRGFRVPEDVPTGELVSDDTKRFTATVRVLDEGVVEIPSLAYSWFDPDSREYQTTHSRPIALSVRSAEVISAGDVEVADGGDGEPGRDAAPPDGEAAGRPRSFPLTGADLAIAHDPAAVLGGSVGRVWLPPALYAGSALLLVAALWDRRRRRVDPEQRRRRRALARELTRVRDATTAAELGDALRRMVRERPGAASPELDAFLGECDARSYAPEGEGGLDDDFVAEATRLAGVLAAEEAA